MDYTKFSREELIERIEELEKLNYEFQMEGELLWMQKKI